MRLLNTNISTFTFRFIYRNSVQPWCPYDTGCVFVHMRSRVRAGRACCEFKYVCTCVCFHACFLQPSHQYICRISQAVLGKKKHIKWKGWEIGWKRKSDYLGRLGELLTVLLLNLLQPAVGLQQEGRGECEKEICRQTDRETQRERWLWNWIFCQDVHTLPAQSAQAHTLTNTLMLTSATWQRVPMVQACGLFGTVPVPRFMCASR